MKVLFVAASLSPEWGGPPKVVLGLAEALAKKGVGISIFSPIEKHNQALNTIYIPGVNIRFFPRGILSKFWTSYSLPLAKALMQEVSNFDLIHIHEIWHYPHFSAYKACKFWRKPYIITIHGALEPWCLDYKKLKKKFYWHVIQRKILQEASGLHAITKEEVKNIKRLVNNHKIFLIPNGINIEEFKNLPEKEYIEYLYPEFKDKKIILFMGRIHPIKGLDLLAKSFGLVLKKRRDVHLVIVGPDSDGYKNKIVKELENNNALAHTTFTGYLEGKAKLAILNRSDIFVLPSYSEGFPMSVLEAMASRLPVIITPGCNFPEVEKNKAGFVIEPQVETITNAIINLANNKELRKEMGKNGQNLIKNNYDWAQIVNKLIVVYDDILNKKFTSPCWENEYDFC